MTSPLILRVLLLGFVLATFPAALFGQNLAERMGYPPDTKLIIVHADDLGETHSVNTATIKALQTGTINSASLMVPCPWFPEIADYAKSHPDADFGLHLTLTSDSLLPLGARGAHRQDSEPGGLQRIFLSRLG